MGSEQVKTKLDETLRSSRELLKAVRDATHEQLRKNVPAVTGFLDNSFNDASKTLSEFIESVDKKSKSEQLELLRAYRSLLSEHSEVLDRRISALDREVSTKSKTAR